MSGFTGFPAAAFDWFEGIIENNNKEWFEANRATFDASVKAPMVALFDEAQAKYGGTIKLARPNRDVRFSPNKMPYKQNLFAVLHSRPDLKPGEMTSAGLYASLDAFGLYGGTGYYDMSSDQLKRYREAIDDRRKAAKLREAVDQASMTLDVRGRSLKTAPKGCSRDHPHIELLRMKEIVAGRQFDREEAQSARVRDDLFRAWDAAAKLIDWLDAHVGPSELPPEERVARRPRKSA